MKKLSFELRPVYMSHDGEILKSLLDELGVKNYILADKIGKNENTIGRWFKKDKISSDNLIAIGKALRFDLRHKFPRLKKIPEANELNFFNEDPSTLLNVVEDIKADYKTANQESADLRQKVEFLKDQIEQLKELIEAKNQIIAMKDATIAELKKNTQ